MQLIVAILENSKAFHSNFENRTTTLPENPFSNSVKEIKSMCHRYILIAMFIIVKNGNSEKTKHKNKQKCHVV